MIFVMEKTLQNFTLNNIIKKKREETETKCGCFYGSTTVISTLFLVKKINGDCCLLC